MSSDKNEVSSGTSEDSSTKVSPPKKAKVETFTTAFSKLKQSEFFKNELPEASQPSTSSASKLNCLQVNPKQKGNPVLKFITSVPWEFSEMVPDFIMGWKTCALFLSLRYHQLNPDYIHDRLKALGNAFTLRVLLVQVDVPDPHHSLKHLTRICILADLTLMLAWNADDAGKILETYKAYENKPPDLIMERSDTSSHQKLMNALTSVRSVNKTDAMTLLKTFGTLENIVKTTPNTLALCPGFGTQKAQRLHKTLHEPFLKSRNSNSTKK